MYLIIVNDVIRIKVPYSCKQSHAWVFALDHHVCIICLESTPLTSWKETECNPKKYVFFTKQGQHMQLFP